MGGRYHITTMGCQMNEYDSDYLAQLLLNSDYLPAMQPRHADLIIINTCSVRAKAEQKALSLLGRMIRLKRKNPDIILGLMGCVAQQGGAALLERYPELDFVVGTREIDNVPQILKSIVAGGGRTAATNIDLKPTFSNKTPGFFKARVTSFISVMEGCNNFCSYCIVPFVRGREVSRSPEEVLKETEDLVAQGVREVTLLGQNVNSYSYGQGKRVGFPSLLSRLDRIPGLARIRFTTSHPKDLSDELIHCFIELERLCPHIHLPVQAGSNRVLARMNRGYTVERYFDLIHRLREVRPDIAITSDVMVGFPGEADEDFRRTLDLIREVEFDTIYSFKYSDRKGTQAEKMEGKVDEDTSTFRLRLLQDTQREITLRKNKALEGREVEVLVEGHSKKGGQLTGRTWTNKIVNFTCKNAIKGNLVNILVNNASTNSLRGDLAGTPLY